MTRREIIETLAHEKRVEALVVNIARHPLTDDLRDLCQMVYVILLEYDEEKIQDLWENDQIDFFIIRILLNQYKSANSPFYKMFRKFQSRSVYMGVGTNINDDAIDRMNRRYKPRYDDDGE